jgi:hypothetical protein
MAFIENILNSKILEDPWKHQIVDDFFDQETFVLLRAKCKTLIRKYGTPKDSNIDPTNITMIKHDLGLFLYDRLFEYNGLLLKYHKEILDLYPDHRSYESYYSMPSFHFITGDAGYHHIHDETLDKTLSIVVYLDPEISHGTKIYSGESENDFCFEVPWKPNRALFFCGEKQKTWHSFGSSSYPRCTMNFFLRQNILPEIINVTESEITIRHLNGNKETLKIDTETQEIINLIQAKKLTD